MQDPFKYLNASFLITGLLALSINSSPAANVSVTGLTEPVFDVTVSSSVAGKLDVQSVKLGEFVKKDQVLIVMRKEVEELDVKRKKLIWESKAELEAAEANVTLKKHDYETTAKLLEATKSVSKEDVAIKKLEYVQAVAQRDSLAIIEEREQLDYELAQEGLSMRIIRSPLDGYVVERFFEVGEDCRAQEPLLRIVDTRRAFFVANMEARLGYQLKLGQEVEIEVDAGKAGEKFRGKVTYVAPVVDPGSGLLKVKAVFENADGRVKPGVSARLKFSTN
ncbi:MAG: RND family efflux transporter MFP subunit [Candidatus Binatia bacterium]|jgi:RND family efflux transporter MFP subunit